MKKQIIIMSLALIVGMISSCRKEYKEIGELPSKVDGITASWVLNMCEVIDKGAIIEETMNITPFFYSDTKLPNITFSMESGVGTYSCDTSHVAYQFFGGTKGTWKFDNAEYPTKVMLTPSGSTDVITFPLVATIRPTDTYLKMDKSVMCGGAEKSVYRLTFIRN
jgi:hypothetical protein